MAPVVAEQTSLRDIIGGRWAVSWQGNLLLFPISVLFIMFTEPAFASVDQWVEGILVSSVAYLAAVGILSLAEVTVLRNRRTHPVPIWLVALAGGVAWMARSAVLKTYLDLQGLPSQAPLGQRLVYGFVLGAVMIPITAWTMAAFANFYQRRRQLVDELVHEELKTQHLTTYVEAMHQGIVDRVQRSVTRTAGSVRWSEKEDETSLAEGIKALDSVSQEAARELSANLWQQAQRSASLNPLLIIRSGATTRPFNYWSIIPIFVFAIPVLLRVWPLGSTLVIVVVPTIYALAVSIVANYLAPRLSPNAALASYGVAVALLLASGLVVYGLVQVIETGSASAGSLPWLAALGYGFIYPLGGPLTAIGTAQREALDRLRASISQQEITNAALQREEQRIRREIATALHGSWSGNLTAVSMRLQQAIDDGDKQAANEALFEARRLIDIDIASVARRESADLEAILTTLATAWDGLVEITTNVAVTEDLSPTLLASVEDVVTEGINNAVRHGDASRIDVAVESVDSSVTITITDNGMPSGPRVPGLGSKLFDSLAPDAWSRTSRTDRSDHGTVLTVRIRAAATLN